ncbi:MAG: lipocalin family protein [Desulfobulbaceae bacterium]|nr:lipocalin family protein [Desulfobulbaceae bacterium]
MSRKKTLITLVTTLLLAGCTGIPENIKPIDDFQLNNYLGTWYEIARLDHSFEQGLTNVTGQYSLREDGGVQVVNKGFSKEDQEWKIAEGKAYFVNDPDVGHLKVSFFGPFYSSYVIFDLDTINYHYAFITSYSKKYLWLLARTPKVSDELMQQFIETARTKGFDTQEIIFVEQEPADF